MPLNNFHQRGNFLIIAVCVPTTHGRTVSLMWAVNTHTVLANVPHVLAVRTDYSVDRNREALAEQALATPGVAHILWMDDDIWPPPNVVPGMLARKYPIVSGVYVDKQNRMCAGMFSGDGSKTPLVLNRVPAPAAGQITFVDAVGLGFCLMETNIFRRLKQPWFESASSLSEDFRLFRRCGDELGIRVLLDGNVPLGHEQQMRLSINGSVQPLATVMQPTVIV